MRTGEGKREREREGGKVSSFCSAGKKLKGNAIKAAVRNKCNGGWELAKAP